MTDQSKGTKPESVKRSDIENAVAKTISIWLRAHAMNRAAGAVTGDPHLTTVNATAAQTMLLIAAGIEGGEWRPDWRPQVVADSPQGSA
jgi:hypothetical protein